MDDVFVEGIQNALAESAIVPSPVEHNQAPEELELRYGKVGAVHSLPALLAADTDADLGLLNHADVVCAVSDRKSHWCRLDVILNESDYEGLLAGRYSAGNDCLTY